MFLTAHASVGIIVGQNTSNIWLAFVLGFVFHFILDIIPHGDETLVEEKNQTTEKEVERVAKIGLLDFFIMTSMILFLVYKNLITLSWPVFFAICGSILPDFITGFYLLFKHKWLKWYIDFHRGLHFILRLHVSFKIGIIIQLITVLILLLIII